MARPVHADFCDEFNDLIAIELTDFVVRRVGQEARDRVLLPGPGHRDDCKLRIHLTPKLTKLCDALRRQVRVVNHDSSGREIPNCIFKRGDIPTVVEQTPVFVHESLNDEGLADAGFTDEKKVAAEVPQTLHVLFPANWLDDRRWAPRRRNSRERSRLSSDAQKITSPARIPIEQWGKGAAIVDVDESYFPGLLKVAR